MVFNAFSKYGNMKKISSIIGFICICYSVYSQTLTINDKNLEVAFNQNTSILSVKDKRNGKVWEQLPYNDRFALRKANKKGEVINLILKGDFDFSVRIWLSDQSDLMMEVSSRAKSSMDRLGFPTAFVTPNKDNYLLHTDGEGFLLAVDDKEYRLGNKPMYSMSGGLCMPWMGITDNEFEAGYMAIIDTPFDAAMRTFRHNDLATFEPVWLSAKGQFAYNRTVIYHFFDKGGYVAQAKKYRKYAWAKNNVTNLKAKQAVQPVIEKMMGAPQIFLWDNAREVDFLKELKSSGIEKAFIFWDPSHLPYPVAGYDDFVREQGYLSGVYELYRDVHKKDTIVYERTGKDKEMTLDRYHYPGMFNDIVLVNKEGKFHYSGFGYDVNIKALMPHISKLRVDRELAIYPHDSYFLDAFMASGLHECYRKDFPLTMLQYKDAVIDLHKMFLNDYKMIVGGEWGADYLVPYTSYVQGMTTLHHTLYGTEREKKGTIYYQGDWENNERPTIMIGSFTAEKNYHKWAIDEKIRIPLYQLVYHDAVVSTWRWDDANHHMPELWWKKDLYNVLYGTAPIWSIDKDRWEAYKNSFLASYKNIAPWLQSIAYDDLVSHRFVSEDRKVQESVFSSGKKVWVNFGDLEYKKDGKIIPARGYVIF
jgi:hypothetical protein